MIHHLLNIADFTVYMLRNLTLKIFQL